MFLEVLFRIFSIPIKHLSRKLRMSAHRISLALRNPMPSRLPSSCGKRKFSERFTSSLLSIARDCWKGWRGYIFIKKRIARQSFRSAE
jgi:hypothetical protein